MTHIQTHGTHARTHTINTHTHTQQQQQQQQTPFASDDFVELAVQNTLNEESVLQQHSVLSTPPVKVSLV